MRVNKKHIKTFFVASLVCGIVGLAYADTSIDDAKDKKAELEKELNETNNFISELETLKANEKAYIKALDGKLEEIAGEIYELQLSKEAKEKEIAATEEQIVKTQADIDEQYANMKLRIQYMYENGEASDLDMLFNSQNMSDVLNKAEYINKITEYDRNMLLKLQSSKDSLEQQKAKLESERADLNNMIAEQENKQKSTELLLAEKQSNVASYEGQISSQEEDAAKLEKEIKEQEQIIKELEEIERRRKESNLEIMYDGGQMMWPLKGYTKLSDDYGLRPDPFGRPTTVMHHGIDIPAPAGTPIYAAYDGQVAWSYYSGSPGNWVGIDHGNGLYTVYMHMSKRLVTEGTYVKKGDVIGLVGTTGSSTGNHLHFAVRLNGSYVDPKNYVTP